MLTICLEEDIVPASMEDFTVTDSITRISDLSSLTSDGTGSAREKRRARRFRQESDHDTVTISDEARRRFSSEDDEWDAGNED